MEIRKAELENIVAAQRDVEAQSQAIPDKIRAFFENYSKMDVRQRKAILQGILKAVDVFNDGRVELTFR